MGVLVVSKITSLEHYRRQSGFSGKKLHTYIRKKGIDLKRLVANDTQQRKTLEKVQSVLAKKGIEFDHQYTDRPGRKKTYDLIISVGGDGTLLSTSHKIQDDTPFLGVNSDIKRSRGMLACCSASTFERKLDALLSGSIRPTPCTRLQVKVEGIKKAIPSVLNDVFIGGEKPFETVRYSIAVDGGRKVLHMDSGLVVSTGAGSTAWIYNAARVRPSDVKHILLEAGCKVTGARVRKLVQQINDSHIFPRTAKKMRYFSRDIIHSKITSSSLECGFAKKIVLQSGMYKGFITIDSRHTYDFSNGRKAEITVAKDPLMLVE